MRPRLARVAPLIVFLGMSLFAPSTAGAQEWYDLYEKGVAALRKRQPVIAASLFERAIRKQPSAGDNILTYGTNRLPKYYPYLKLAEALAMAGDFERARKALERSETSGKEPPGERALVLKLINAATRADAVQVPPDPSPLPSLVPSALPSRAPPAPSATKPVSAQEPLPDPTAAPPPSASAAAKTTAAEPPPAAPAPSPRLARASPAPSAGLLELTVSSPPSAASPELATSVLELTTSPVEADVYLDGEFIGRSDGTGRLVKRGVAQGAHQLRVGGVDGFQDRQDAIEVAGESARRIMILDRQAGAPRKAPILDGRGLILGSLVLVLLASLIGGRLAKSRRSSPSTEPAETGQLATELKLHRTPGTYGGPTQLRTPAGVADLATIELPHGSGSLDGSMFGDFQLVEQIGKGGMASVFRARRRGEDVALKRPLAAFLAESEFVERFSREAEIGRTLNHPNIIRIFEKGRVGNVPYFTMELVDGETLHSRAQREGALSPLEACGVVKQVAEALDYSHLKGVIHRDLKPSNIMILNSGTVKVMDYGIARSARLEGLTATGAFLGTPEYVAPETAEGGRTDARSDLYSLGVVFYEILTGVRPFVGDTPFATLKKICSEPPTPPSAVRKCPAELEGIVLKLLRKNPSDRHASAEDLLNDLNDYLNRAA